MVIGGGWYKRSEWKISGSSSVLVCQCEWKLYTVGMVVRTFCTGLFLITSVYLLLSYQLGLLSAAPNKDVRDRPLPRSANIERYSRYPQYARIKAEPFLSDFIVDDDDFLEFSKRQQSSDDYGHLRFGRRNGEEVSDDYGHMRFGRSGSDKK